LLISKFRNRAKRIAKKIGKKEGKIQNFGKNDPKIALFCSFQKGFYHA
jgi:hypothetical protein